MRRSGRRTWVTTGALGGVLLLGGLADARADGRARPGEDADALWVYFVDKRVDYEGDGAAAGGLGFAPGLDLALETRAAELSPRALSRRQRARGDLGVDARDLPVAQEYVDVVLATGARERVRSRWLNALSVDATPAQRAAIATLPEVARVEPVRAQARERLVITREAAASPPEDAYFGIAYAQLSMIGAAYLQQCGLTGKGVVLGVQDSGFVLDHVAFDNLEVLAAHDFVGDDDDVGEEDGDPEGQYSHGTLVLSAAAGAVPGVFMGAAPGVSVILSKTEDVSQEVMAEEDYYVAGLEWIESQGADIFTASLGYFDWYTQDDLDGQTAVTTVAANVATANGLIMFNSNGNGGPEPTTMGAPADSPGIISIGAVTPDGEVAGFSSRGPTADGRIKPDVSALGVAVKIAAPGTIDAYGQANGTSLSAPLAAGLAALLLEAHPDLTPETMGDLLRSTASRADDPNNDVGWGVLDGHAAVGESCTCSDVDGDGYLDVLCGGDDCDDAHATANPAGEEVCDGIDNDCDGAVGEGDHDEDFDGVLACEGDCDDNNPAIHPGAEEVCEDGVDNDCQDGDALCPDETTDGSGGEASGGEDPSIGPGGTSDGESDGGGEVGTESGDADPGAEGCSCAAGGRRGAPWAWLSLGLVALTRRRRL